MVVSSFIKDTFAASRLISFSTSRPFLDIDFSRRLLHQIENPNAFIWNTLMRACVHRFCPQHCIPLYRSMLWSGSVPDNYTPPILAQACTLCFSKKEGEQIHTHVLKFGFDSDVYVQNTLINMYSVCGDLGSARLLFDTSLVLDSVSWNSILAAYVQIGDVDEAVLIFNQMPQQNTVAANSMIVLFGRSNRAKDARELFDGMHGRDLITWTAMISCYDQNELFSEALEMFFQMNKMKILVDEVVMISVLSACARLMAIREGKLIHGLIVRTGLEAYINLHNALIYMYSSCNDIFAARQLFNSGSYLDQISWNSMLSGYLKHGLVGKADEVFQAMPLKDVVSWSTMISGYAQHGRFSDSLKLFNEMHIEGIRPDETTLVSVMSACTHLSALEQETALEIFNEMEEKGVSTWNAIIMGLAMNGRGEDSLQKFSEMERCGVVPNEITAVVVLGACRHAAGLVDEGLQIFNYMQQVYGILPNVIHYGCMVDLLGRSGLLKEAEKLIESMPMTPDKATWGALFGACMKHDNTEIGERLGRSLLKLEPEHDGFHVLLSNTYASKGMWEDAMELRGIMKQRGVVKMPGCSSIELPQGPQLM